MTPQTIPSAAHLVRGMPLGGKAGKADGAAGSRLSAERTLQGEAAVPGHAAARFRDLIEADAISLAEAATYRARAAKRLDAVRFNEPPGS